ncbi:amidohydrolase family protein (plasmid) [Pantoea agglomerans]|nr:amidohydrolase family protein [Pantoea agglomerans]WIL44384.1 amidohydrolase family protein [Pantoea agglomerans]
MKLTFMALLSLFSCCVAAETVGYRAEIVYFKAVPAKEKEANVHYEDGYLIVKDGYILKSGDYATIKDQPVDQLINYSGKIITPGFVDTHVHYPQITMISEYGKQLNGWLNTYTFPTEIKFRNHHYAQQQASEFLDQLVNNGTTTALVFATSSPASVDAFFEQAIK